MCTYRLWMLSAIALLAIAACGGTATSSPQTDAGTRDGNTRCPQDIGCPSGWHWSDAACTCVFAADAAVDAPVDGPLADNPCTRAGGFCQPTRPENLTCPSGTYAAEFPGVDCSPAVGQTCCFARSAQGDLPPATDGTCACGNVLCVQGSTCRTGTDTISCGGPDAGANTCTPP